MRDLLRIEQALEEMNFNEEEDNKNYFNIDGVAVPRVTNILQKTSSSEVLMIWSNRLGFRGISYKSELERAANVGTETHSQIETYLNEGKIGSSMSFKGFLLWYNNLCLNNKVSIIGTEEKMGGRYFGGTYDCLININGKIYLVDFKTSNRVTEKYFLQLAAYRTLLFELKGIIIDGCIILQLNKKQVGFNEYVLDFSIMEHLAFIEDCYRCFLSMVYTYYNQIYIEKQFTSLFNI